MAISTRTMRIAGASLAAVVLVGGAYILGGPNPFSQKTANAESTQELLRAYAAKDSDNDGLPDWEEALYGTDPNNPHSVDATLTDGQAVAKGLVKPKFSSAASSTPATTLDQVPSPAPTTLTDQFARQLYGQFLAQADGTEPTPDQVATYVQSAVNDFVASKQVPDAYSMSDVVVAPATGPDALRAYAAAAEAAFAAHKVPTEKDPLGYMYDAMNGNTADYAHLSQTAAADAAIAKALIKVPVPQEAAYAHLEIANAMMHMSDVTADMAAYPKDPLRGALGIGLYQTYGPSLVRGFGDLYKVFQAEQVSVPLAQPGGDYYDTMRVSVGFPPQQ